MAKFTSIYDGLILQDEKGPPWAHFHDGEFETDDAKVIARLQGVDYIQQVESDEPKPLDKMKVDELRKYAEDNSVDLGDATKKEDILAAIALAAESSDQN